MPKTTKSGSARKSELPSTLQKSDAKAQRTFAKAHDAAAEEYGEGERAHRVAYSALKHSYEKVGDHWESKSQKVRRIRGRAAAARTPRATPPRASTPMPQRSTSWKSLGAWISRDGPR